MASATAADAMETAFPRIDPKQKARQAVLELMESGWPCGLVLGEDGALLGAFGRREVLRALSERTGGFFSAEELAFACLRGEAFTSEALRNVWNSSWDAPVESIMGRAAIVSEGTTLATVARRLARGDEDLAAVVRDGRVIGAVRPRDIVAYVAGHPGRVRGKVHPRARPGSG